jgi:Putative Actinobacterial Holin-X, holin superfamily III
VRREPHDRRHQHVQAEQRQHHRSEPGRPAFDPLYAPDVSTPLHGETPEQHTPAEQLDDGYMVLLFASIAAWWGLATVIPIGWAALIVTAIWAVIGAVLYQAGRRRMRQDHAPADRGNPQETA